MDQLLSEMGQIGDVNGDIRVQPKPIIARQHEFGPGGGSEEKPVGLVWFSVAGPGEERLTRSVNLPGSRADIRDRATTVALHLIRRALEGEGEARTP